MSITLARPNDRDLIGLDKFKPMVKASGKSTPSGHPLVVSLRPAAAEGTLPRLTEPVAEHQAVRVKTRGQAGTEKIDLVFDLVFQGRGHIQ